ncbi:MAG TPA: hypothetical protein VJV21_01925 [Pyrinomonadaceae bacterium]|nr:hypothetical protein [Pyrinomonadaceae bacterium]
MKTLKIGLLMTLLVGTAAAQGSTAQVSTNKDAPDLVVIKTSWRKVERFTPTVNEASGGNPEYAARMAVNTARINEFNSARQSGADVPPPKLLSVPSTPSLRPAVHSWSGYRYEFTVKNTGAKLIRQVVFEHSFIDPRTQKKLGRRQYKSNVKIRPSLTAKLVVYSSRRPIGTIDVTQTGQQDQSQEQVVIQRIKYADGSVWERAAQ